MEGDDFSLEEGEAIEEVGEEGGLGDGEEEEGEEGKEKSLEESWTG